MRILFITLGSPFPPNCGAQIRDFHLIKEVSKRHSVFLLALLHSQDQVSSLYEMKRCCEYVDFAVLSQKPTWGQKFFLRLNKLLRGWPLASDPFFSEDLWRKISELVSRDKFDVVQIEHSFLSPYVDAIPQGAHCKTVLSFHNVGFMQYRSMLNIKTGFGVGLLLRLKSWLLFHLEKKYISRFDLVITVSSKEKEFLGEFEISPPTIIIENGVDLEHFQPLEEKPEKPVLLFVGNLIYGPNAEAVLFFSHDVFPLIKKQVPEVEFWIVGQRPPDTVRILEKKKNIKVFADVPDVRPYYRQACISVVPLMAGGGTRLKILEAMALGRPVISTSIGCEGLSVTEGRDIVIADSKEMFAEKSVQLLTDSHLRDSLCMHARKLLDRHNDWITLGLRLGDGYEELMKTPILSEESALAGNHS